MPRGRLIVCESTSRWAVALRRRLRRGGDVDVGETRYLEDCWRQATAHPASIVALEATAANLEQLVISMNRYRIRLPRMRAVVLADRRLAEGEWLLREAGAVHVVFSSRDLAPVVRLVRRHFDRVAAVASTQSTTAWERLPWGETWDTSSVLCPAWLQD